MLGVIFLVVFVGYFVIKKMTPVKRPIDDLENIPTTEEFKEFQEFCYENRSFAPYSHILLNFIFEKKKSPFLNDKDGALMGAIVKRQTGRINGVPRREEL